MFHFRSRPRGYCARSDAAVIFLIKLVIMETDADPYLLTGSLVESIVTTLVKCVPAEKRSEVAVETMRLLRDRLAARGMI